MTSAASAGVVGHSPGFPAEVDASLPFVPERFCPFFHLPQNHGLPDEIVLRQNQLHACALLEMIQVFERLGRRALATLAARFDGTTLADHIAEFISDEERHSARFAAFNRMAAPEIYLNGDAYFCRMSPLARRLSDAACNASFIRFWPWLMHLQEEKSLFISRIYGEESNGLEPGFVRIHREHAADEAHHVGWDRELIDRVWLETAPWLRKLNAGTMTWLVKEFFHTPKRAGMRLLGRLEQEFPKHAATLRLLRPSMARLGEDPGWHRSAYSPEMLPKTLALMKRFPEFQGMTRFIYGQAVP